MRILLAAAGITVLKESPIGQAHCTKRTPTNVYAKGINTGGNIGEINTRQDKSICLSNII